MKLQFCEARNMVSPGRVLGLLLFSTLGVVFYNTSFPWYWNLRILADFFGWTATCFFSGFLIRRAGGKRAHALFVGGLGLYISIGAGLAESAATVFFVLSTWLVGRLLLCLVLRKESGVVSLGGASFVVGLALQFVVFGILVHFPVNFRALYFLILFAPIVVVIASNSFTAHTNFLVLSVRKELDALSKISYWNFVFLAALLGYVARFAFFPSVGYDDNAQHLRMWSELATTSVYTFDVGTQIWEVAPFALDLLHAIVSMLAGSDARSALNLAILFLLFRKIWMLSSYLEVAESDRLLVVMLFASTPIVANLLTSLQTELFLALLVASGVFLGLERNIASYGARVFGLFSVAAMCCATKLPGAVLAAVVLLAYVPSYMGNRGCVVNDGRSVRWVWGTAFSFFLFFVAFHSYFVAWWITGNPLFPLYNEIFKSPYLPESNFSDLRYVKGFDFHSYWNVFFKTSEYFESRDFVAGFQYLLLFPISVAALFWRVGWHKAWVLLVPLFGFGLVMFSVTQYWRYVFPVLPLASIIIGSVLPKAGRISVPYAVSFSRVAVIFYVAVNFYFYPGISWFFTVQPQAAYTESGRQSITEQFAPVKAITQQLNARVKGARVLYPEDSPFGATLAGYPLYVNWYSPARAAKFAAMRSTEDVVAFLKTERPQFVILDMASRSLPGESKWVFREHVSRFGLPEIQVGSNILYRLFDHQLYYHEVFSLEDGFKSEVCGAARGEVGGEGSICPPGVLANQSPQVVGTFNTKGSSVARYSVKFNCRALNGNFIAQINWSSGAPYYRLVPCSSNGVSFAEAIPVPVGASSGEVYVTVRGETDAYVSKLAIEMN